MAAPIDTQEKHYLGAVTASDCRDTETLGHFYTGIEIQWAHMSYWSPWAQLHPCAGTPARTEILWPARFYWYRGLKET